MSFFYIIFQSNYFQATQTAVFYKKNMCKMFKRNSFMFLDLQVSSVQNKKKKAEEKFTVKRWPKKL